MGRGPERWKPRRSPEGDKWSTGTKELARTSGGRLPCERAGEDSRAGSIKINFNIYAISQLMNSRNFRPEVKCILIYAC